VCTDVDSNVKESNEGNNCDSITFTIQAKKYGPDLIIKSPTASPGEPIEGDFVSFSGVVKNQGEVFADESTTQLRMDLGGDGTWDVTLYKIVARGLPRGGSFAASWPSTWKAQVGTHIFEICSDTANQVAESDENNNCALATIYVKEKL